MQISQLKAMIESSSKDPLPTLVFEYANENQKFIALQYINALCKLRNYSINKINSLKYLNYLIESHQNVFYVVDIETLDKEVTLPRTAVVCKKDNTGLNTKIGTVENWMIEDYVEGITGLNKNSVKLLCTSYDYNLPSIDNECLKYKYLTTQEKQNVFDENKNQYFISTNLKQVEYTLANAFLDKNKKLIVELVKNKDQLDINEYSVYILLYKKIKLLINILLDKNTSAAALDISTKQFNFIKYRYTNLYVKNELEYKIFKLSELEYKLKSGKCIISLLDEILMIW